MSILTTAQKKRGNDLATRQGSLETQQGELRWDWGDWAIDVAGPPSPDTTKDGSGKKLKDGLAELDHAGSCMIPEFVQVRHYRIGAYAIQGELRGIVRSPWAGEMLWQEVKDEAERTALIHELAKSPPRGLVTERKIRDHFGRSSKDGPRVENQDELHAIMAAAEAAETSPAIVRAGRPDLEAATTAALAVLQGGGDYEEAVVAAREAIVEYEADLEEVVRRGKKAEHDKRQRQAWLLVDGELEKAHGGLRKALQLLREVEITDAERKAVRGDVENIQALANTLAMLIITGESVDWDGELGKLLAGSES